MKLYLKAPLYNKSKTIPHLLEHTLSRADLDIFFGLSYDMDGSVYSGYTLFEDIKNIDLLIDMIKTSPTKDIIDYEIKVLKEEFEDVKYGQGITEKLGKNLYGEEYRLNSVGKISYKEIYEYHKKNFQNPTYIITDDDNNIIRANNLNTQESTSLDIGKLFNIKIKYRSDWNNMFYMKMKNVYEYYLMNFLFSLYESHNEYMNRYIKGKYNYIGVWYHRYEDCLAINLPIKYKLDVDRVFFDRFKRYFLDNMSSKDMKETMIEAMILYNFTVDIDKIKEFIKKLDYDFVRNLTKSYK